MKAKAKKFSHKLLALFMAILMAATCLTGALTSYAAVSSSTGYVDSDVQYNDLGWNILSNEQVCTAALDVLDEFLAPMVKYEEELSKTVNSLDIPVVSINWNLNDRQIHISAVIYNIDVTVKIGSVNEVFETLYSVRHDVLESSAWGTLKGLLDLGDLESLSLNSIVSNMSSNARGKYSSTDLIRAILGIIYDNNNTPLIGELLRGDLNLGLLDGMLDVYGLIGGLVGVGSGYQNGDYGAVYNIVKSLLLNKTNWFTSDEKAGYNSNPSSFKFDTVLIQKLTTELLDKINVLVTYNQEYSEEVPDGLGGTTTVTTVDTSASRYQKIKAKMQADECNYATAAAALGYDPNLVYANENLSDEGDPQNILLFAYGSPDEMGFATSSTSKIVLGINDSLFKFGFSALSYAWKTVLQDTLQLVHVNYDVDRGHGSNFDNTYYYYMDQKGLWTGNPSTDYSAAKVETWLYDQDVYEAYGFTSGDDFKEAVQDNFRYDRSAPADSQGTWRDIDEETLFNKVRFSPLAAYYFDMPTGPVNLYFLQTGTPNLDAFFGYYNKSTGQYVDGDYENYSSMAAALNDALVAAAKDFLPNDSHVNGTVPTFTKTNNISGTIDDTKIKNIVNVLVPNVLKALQYIADATDLNILKGFYDNGGTTLTEENLETAMIPLLVAALGQVNVSGIKLEDLIHPEDWDKCGDAEAVAFVALREYLSYILPDVDYNGLATNTDRASTAKIGVTMEGTILPMARDALIYVIEPYVPLTLGANASAASWKVEDHAGETHSQANVFTLLNSVVCYYACTFTSWTVSARSGEKANGAAPLLGFTSYNGGEVKYSNTLWQNLDIIVNGLLPVTGTLQYGSGSFNSYDLIWNDIVSGILNISEVRTSNLRGLSNFVYRLLKIVCATPIQTNRIVDTVYDLLEKLINQIFGARESGQSDVIPVRSTTYPFDNLLMKSVIAGTSSNMGVICRLLNNLIEFTGYNNHTDTLSPGAAFAVSAANSFLNFFPMIGDHDLKMATATFEQAVVTGLSEGDSNTYKVTIKNECQGINIAYVDGMTGNLHKLSRYYVKPTGATISNVSGNGATGTISSAPSTATISPRGTTDFTVTTKHKSTSASDPTVTYKVTVTYNILNGSGQTLYTGLKTDAYQVLSSGTDWKSVVYPNWSDAYGVYTFATEIGSEGNTQGTNMGSSTYKAKTTSLFTATAGNRLFAQYPAQLVLSSSDLGSVDTMSVRLYNKKSGNSGVARSLQGIYFYDTGTVFDTGSGQNKTVGSANAIPIFDEDGNILLQNRFDMYYDGAWDTNSGSGYTSAAVNDKVNNVLTDAQKAELRTRTHVVASFSAANAAGAIYAYHLDENGKFDQMYLQSGSGQFAYATLLGNISVRGPVKGLYFNSTAVSVPAAEAKYTAFLKYDGSTSIGTTIQDAHVCFFNSTLSATADIEFIVCNFGDASSIADKADNLKAEMSKYTDTDLEHASQMRAAADSAISKALGTSALTLTPESGKMMVDTESVQWSTATTTNTYGDRAYTPLTATQYNNLSEELKAIIYEVNSKYYFDEDGNIPVYSTTVLARQSGETTFPTVVEDGAIFIQNTAHHDSEWVDTGIYSTYPAKIQKSEQAENREGQLLYDQVQWSYYDATGSKVSSGGAWVIKVPDAGKWMTPNTTSVDNRSIFTKASDLLDYTTEKIHEDLTAGSSSRLMNEMSLLRSGMDESDYGIVAYNKMTDLAKDVEKMYTLTYSYTETFDDGTTKFNEDVETDFATYWELVNNDKITIENNGAYTLSTTLSSTQIDNYINQFNDYMAVVKERGYIGNQLEAEIVCASGNAYTAYNVTEAVYTDGTRTTDAVVRSNGASNPAFGVFENGELVNNGAVVYPTALWTNYVEALAHAVAQAQFGHGAYTHKTAAYYDDSDKDNYTDQITDVYNADTALQAAEIALENTKVVTITLPAGASATVNGDAYTKPMAVPYKEYAEVQITPASGMEFSNASVTVGSNAAETVTDNPFYVKVTRDTAIVPSFVSALATTVNVSAKLVVATSATGANNGTGVTGDYTVTIYDSNNDVYATEVFTMDQEDSSTFDFDLEAGTYTATIESQYANTRDDITISVSGVDDIVGPNIPIVCSDFNKDGSLTAMDAIALYSAAAGSAPSNDYDLNCDGIVTAMDAIPLYSIAGASSVDLPAVAIEG
jgi:hypothetical protein